MQTQLLEVNTCNRIAWCAETRDRISMVEEAGLLDIVGWQDVAVKSRAAQ